MSANYSTATQTRAYEYRPTLIDNKFLVSRLVVQIVGSVIIALLFTLTYHLPSHLAREEPIGNTDLDQMVFIDLKNESAGVGFNEGKGQGSGPTPKRAQGGGSGGNRNPAPPQTGKLPPPSLIQAAIPVAPPINPPALPAAGIDLDPALWKDLKAPVYGDPRSNSEIPSKGPGEGEGIGTNRGTGIGDGDGPGVFKGDGGNMGGGSRQLGCCGPGGGDPDRQTYTGAEVDQRARLLSKPEPQYTEEARRNQISGTVMLRAVFSSSGEVVQIRALSALPFGLTERAIAAARRIKFTPAMKKGRAVSVHMQLEYNFNLY
jgi:protein TonB